MMDDAEMVSRLRGLADREVTAMPPGWEDAYDLYRESAERIEALIAERDAAKTIATVAIQEADELRAALAAARDAALEEAAKVAEKDTECCQSCAGVGFPIRALKGKSHE